MEIVNKLIFDWFGKFSEMQIFLQKKNYY